jgi:hypothetical protein
MILAIWFVACNGKKKFSEGSQKDLLKPLFLWHFSKKLKMKIFIFKSNKFNQSAIKEIPVSEWLFLCIFDKYLN